MKLKQLRDFELIIKPRRIRNDVWKKYYDLRKKTLLDDKDKYWMKEFRQTIKRLNFEVTCIHKPTKLKSVWAIDSKIEKNFRLDAIDTMKNFVKMSREKAKKFILVNKNFDGASYKMAGNAFVKPGEILDIGTRTTANSPWEVKKPRFKHVNYIGIELEFNRQSKYNDEDVAKAIQNLGLGRYVNVTTDGSCGWEVRVLLPENDYEGKLKQILTAINTLEFKTNAECGTHVHFDMRNRDVKLVYENLFSTQSLLRRFLKTDRKTNMYCKKNQYKTFNEQLNTGDRRYGINPQAYGTHKTLEVRYHHGTLDAKELIPWINFLLKIVNYKDKIDKPVASLKTASKKLELNDELITSLKQKIMARFNERKRNSLKKSGTVWLNRIITNLGG